MLLTPTSSNRSPVQAERITDPDLYLRIMSERAEEATRFLESQGFETVSQNGQRISTNMRFNQEHMDRVKWNEIFIGKLPRDMFEDQLLPFLQVPGHVYRIRFMMDFSRTNRGFCFVKYANVQQALEAIRFLDGRIVVEGKPAIGAKISFDNKCLHFSDLPPFCTEEKLINALRQAEVGDIESVRMSGAIHQIGRNYNSRNRQPPSRYMGSYSFNAPVEEKRTALVYFKSHDAATKARRLLLPGDVKLFKRKIKLDWAKSEIPQEIADQMNLQQAPFNDNITYSGIWSLPAIASPNLRLPAIL